MKPLLQLQNYINETFQRDVYENCYFQLQATIITMMIIVIIVIISTIIDRYISDSNDLICYLVIFTINTS